jgi:hypothetical protein
MVEVSYFERFVPPATEELGKGITASIIHDSAT